MTTECRHHVSRTRAFEVLGFGTRHYAVCAYCHKVNISGLWLGWYIDEAGTLTTVSN